MFNVGKWPLWHMRTAKVQMGVCIRKVWSGHSLFVDIYYSIHWFCNRTTKAMISLRECAGWSGPALSANCISVLFVRFASYHILPFSGLIQQTTINDTFLFLFFTENRLWQFMKIVWRGQFCMKRQNLFSGKNKKTISKISFAERFTQHAKRSHVLTFICSTTALLPLINRCRCFNYYLLMLPYCVYQVT